jgi:hypothetical protein
MAVQAAGMTDIARLLLRNGLLAIQRFVDLIHDLLGIFKGEPVAFRPADRLGVRERRPSIVRAMHIVPGPHGALPEIRAHDARIELFHLVRMAG